MRSLAAGFGVFIIAVVVMADMRHLGFLGWIYRFPHVDKAGHFLLFGLLSLLVNLAVLEQRHTEAAWRVTLRASIVLALLIGFEEFSQRWFPGRTPSWTDLAASYLGVGLFAWAALQIAQRRFAQVPGNQP